MRTLLHGSRYFWFPLSPVSFLWNEFQNKTEPLTSEILRPLHLMKFENLLLVQHDNELLFVPRTVWLTRGRSSSSGVPFAYISLPVGRHRRRRRHLIYRLQPENRLCRRRSDCNEVRSPTNVWNDQLGSGYVATFRYHCSGGVWKGDSHHLCQGVLFVPFLILPLRVKFMP